MCNLELEALLDVKHAYPLQRLTLRPPSKTRCKKGEFENRINSKSKGTMSEIQSNFDAFPSNIYQHYHSLAVIRSRGRRENRPDDLHARKTTWKIDQDLVTDRLTLPTHKLDSPYRLF